MARLAVQHTCSGSLCTNVAQFFFRVVSLLFFAVSAVFGVFFFIRLFLVRSHWHTCMPGEFSHHVYLGDDGILFFCFVGETTSPSLISSLQCSFACTLSWASSTLSLALSLSLSFSLSLYLSIYLSINLSINLIMCICESGGFCSCLFLFSLAMKSKF